MRKLSVAILDDYIDEEYVDLIGCEKEIFNCVLTQRNNTVISHGTKVMATIEKYSKKNVKYLFYSVYNDLSKSSEHIADILSRLIVCKVDVLVMSLTIDNMEIHSRICKLCNELMENGTIIVAAASNDEELSFPATVNSVVGVGKSFCVDDEIVWNGYEGIQILANVMPEFVDIKNEMHLFSGTSKANAIVAAKIINILSENKYGFNDLIKCLRNRSVDDVRRPKKNEKCINRILHRKLLGFLKENGYNVKVGDEEVLFNVIVQDIERFTELVQISAIFLGIEDALEEMHYCEFGSSYAMINYLENRVC